MPSHTYQPFPNLFRQKILLRERLIGCWSSLTSSTTTEILGMTGFDWLLLDGEHTSADVADLSRQLVDLRASHSAAVVRPPVNEPVIIKRLLDAGFHNFLIPFVNSAEEAAAAVAATRYPPQGVRGVSATHRSNGYGTVPNYLEFVNDNICVLVQVESEQAVEAASAMAEVNGVDGLFVGPSDLAASMGYLGQPQHHSVQAAIAVVFDQARVSGKAAGILAPREEDAVRYLNMGATFVAVGVDTAMFRDAATQLHQRFLVKPTGINDDRS